MSARIGGDPNLIQGPGGNTSLKLGGQVWVKASGCWLAHARDREIFVPLRLTQILAQIDAGDAEDFENCVVGAQAKGGMKPSIETALHALMPHEVVVHAHAVNSMTVSVLRHGDQLARERLGDAVKWSWIPYQRPGRRLAQAVRERMADGNFDALILQNHGVIVGASTPDEAERGLRMIEDRLRLPAKEPLASDTARLARVESDDYQVCAELSGVAIDEEMLDLLTSGALIPDQAVFLGGPLPELAPGETASEAAERVRASTGVNPAFIAVRGAGVLGRKERSDAAEPLLRALIEMAKRVPSRAQVNWLSREGVEELLNWDAERYRQAVNRSGPGA